MDVGDGSLPIDAAGFDMAVDLKILLENLPVTGYDPAFPTIIRGFTNDSRNIKPGDIFVAVAGTKLAGSDFLPDAQARGAAGAIVDASLTVPAGVTIPLLRVADARAALSFLAKVYYGDPSNELLVDAFVGTKGKTTSAFMAKSVVEAGFGSGKAAVIGTLGAYGGGIEERTGLTTPESAELQRLLAAFLDAGVEQVSIEYTAHAIALGRGRDIRFRTGVFISFSQDHLDFFGDMEEYLQVKVRFFEEHVAQPDFMALVNIDDPSAFRFLEATVGCSLTFGMLGRGDIRAEGMRTERGKTAFDLIFDEEIVPVEINTVGSYNVHNALGAAGLGIRHGIALEAVAAGLNAFEPVPGRLEAIREGQPFEVLVDYAHSPQSVKAVLKGVSGLGYRRIIAVMGAGGDRDRAKRPLIGEALMRGADVVIITSDNPRSEEPTAIIEEILVGVRSSGIAKEYVAEPDRYRAIKMALEIALAGDAVLILGKGAEDYQEIAGVKYPFDDRNVCRELLREMHSRWI